MHKVLNLVNKNEDTHYVNIDFVIKVQDDNILKNL